MNVLTIAKKHSDFRNIIAHNPLVLTQHEGKNHIEGILNAKSDEIIRLPEILGALRSQQYWQANSWR